MLLWSFWFSAIHYLLLSSLTVFPKLAFAGNAALKTQELALTKQQLALKAAIRGGDVGTVKSLLKGQRDDDFRKIEKFAFEEAIIHKQHSVLDALLATHLDPSSVNERAIRLAVNENNVIAVKKLLTSKRVDPNVALQQAASDGRTDIVKFLIASNPKAIKMPWRFIVNDGSRIYALKSAALNGHEEIVRLLLADRHTIPTELDVETAIFLARNSDHEDIVKLLVHRGKAEAEMVVATEMAFGDETDVPLAEAHVLNTEPEIVVAPALTAGKKIVDAHKKYTWVKAEKKWVLDTAPKAEAEIVVPPEKAAGIAGNNHVLENDSPKWIHLGAGRGWALHTPQTADAERIVAAGNVNVVPAKKAAAPVRKKKFWSGITSNERAEEQRANDDYWYQTTINDSPWPWGSNSNHDSNHHSNHHSDSASDNHHHSDW